MYDAVYFFIYAVALALTVALLRREGACGRVFAPAASPPAQVCAGALLSLGLLLAAGTVNAVLFRSFAVFQFTALPPKAMLNFLAFQLLVAATEELLFRACLTELGRRLRWHWTAIAAASAVLFGACHWLFRRDAVQLVTALAAGLAFSAAYQNSKRCSVYSLILAHFLYDIAIINIT